MTASFSAARSTDGRLDGCQRLGKQRIGPNHNRSPAATKKGTTEAAPAILGAISVVPSASRSGSYLLRRPRHPRGAAPRRPKAAWNSLRKSSTRSCEAREIRYLIPNACSSFARNSANCLDLKLSFVLSRTSIASRMTWRWTGRCGQSSSSHRLFKP
jgi:hypothetical protein